MKESLLKQAIRWVLVIAWLGVIYYFSSQPNLGTALEPFWDTVARKTAHLMEYFILAYLFTKALRSNGASLRSALGMAAVCGVVAAGFDEWHQSGVYGRQGRWEDVAIDSLGVVGYLVLAYRDRTGL